MDGNTGHLIISLLMAVLVFIVRLSSAGMEKRIKVLEELLDEFTKAIEKADDTVDDE